MRKHFFFLTVFLAVFFFYVVKVNAGVHLALNYLYNLSEIKDTYDPLSAELKHVGFGYEGEAGYAFNLAVVRIIPLLSLGQTSLKSGDELVAGSGAINIGTDFKMGRLGYALRIDIGSMIYLKGGGAIYSLTESPAPADNYHLNGQGVFAEGGLAFNLIPFISLVLGARYEKIVYDKYHTSTSEASLIKNVEQTNIAVLVGVGLRI